MAQGMLTEGMKQGDFSEIELPSGEICRVYQDGSVECKGPGEEEFTPRGEQVSPAPAPDLNITL